MLRNSIMYVWENVCYAVVTLFRGSYIHIFNAVVLINEIGCLTNYVELIRESKNTESEVLKIGHSK